MPWIREDRVPTPAELAWLQSPPGRAACQAMAGGEPADTPAAIAHWRRTLEPAQVAAAWNLVTLRVAARAKFTRADEMLFDRVGLEQASDEVVAAHKARRFRPLRRVADLCCGIGGDAVALAAASDVVAVDWSALRVSMAEHNARVYGRQVSGLVGDAAFDWPDAEAVHVDPDRRPGGPRRHQAEECSPGLDVLQRIVDHYHEGAIKLSPATDFEALPFEAEIELISHHDECKQAVAWTGRLRRAQRSATVLPAGESIAATAGESLAWPPPRPVEPGGVLFEPDPGVIRANLVGVLARRHGLAPVDPQIAYLTGGQPISTALLHAFRVIDVMDWSLAKARAWLSHHDIGQLDIKTRGFAGRPEDIRRRLKLSGRRQAVLVLTRLRERPVAILAVGSFGAGSSCGAPTCF